MVWSGVELDIGYTYTVQYTATSRLGCRWERARVFFDKRNGTRTKRVRVEHSVFRRVRASECGAVLRIKLQQYRVVGEVVTAITEF